MAWVASTRALARSSSVMTIELALVVLVALDDLPPRHLDAFGAAHAVVLDRRQIRAVELAEPDLFGGLAGRVQTHWDVDKADTDRAFPDRAGHGAILPQRRAVRAGGGAAG
jgi:hypothetical protein